MEVDIHELKDQPHFSAGPLAMMPHHAKKIVSVWYILMHMIQHVIKLECELLV